MKYSIEDDGVYRVDIINNVVLKIMLVPKDIVLEAAKKYSAYETNTLMDK